MATPEVDVLGGAFELKLDPAEALPVALSGSKGSTRDRDANVVEDWTNAKDNFDKSVSDAQNKVAAGLSNDDAEVPTHPLSIQEKVHRLMQSGDFGIGQPFGGPSAPTPPVHKGDLADMPDEEVAATTVGKAHSVEVVQCFQGTVPVPCSHVSSEAGGVKCPTTESVEPSVDVKKDSVEGLIPLVTAEGVVSTCKEERSEDNDSEQLTRTEEDSGQGVSGSVSVEETEEEEIDQGVADTVPVKETEEDVERSATDIWPVKGTDADVEQSTADLLSVNGTNVNMERSTAESFAVKLAEGNPTHDVSRQEREKECDSDAAMRASDCNAEDQKNVGADKDTGRIDAAIRASDNNAAEQKHVGADKDTDAAIRASDNNVEEQKNVGADKDAGRIDKNAEEQKNVGANKDTSGTAAHHDDASVADKKEETRRRKTGVAVKIQRPDDSSAAPAVDERQFPKCDNPECEDCGNAKRTPLKAVGKPKAGMLKTTVQNPSAIERERRDVPPIDPAYADQYMMYAQQYAAYAQQFAMYAQFCAQQGAGGSMRPLPSAPRGGETCGQGCCPPPTQSNEACSHGCCPPQTNSAEAGPQSVPQQPQSQPQAVAQAKATQPQPKNAPKPIMVTPYRHNWLISGDQVESKTENESWTEMFQRMTGFTFGSAAQPASA